MAKKARFNVMEAMAKWEKGWCWNAVGDKLGYSGRTIKKYVKLTFEDYQMLLVKHDKNHQHSCPKCKLGMVIEQKFLLE